MLEPLVATRVVATPAALDAVAVSRDAAVLRLAPDEALVLGVGPDEISVADEHAIVMGDGGWRGTWMDPTAAERLVTAGADWHPPERQPALAQGMLFQLPVKLWFDGDRVLVFTQHVVAADLAARIGGLP